MNVRPDVTRPDVLARLGQPYGRTSTDCCHARRGMTSSTDGRTSYDAWDPVGSGHVTSEVDTLNPVAVGSFAYVNEVPVQHLLQ